LARLALKCSRAGERFERYRALIDQLGLTHRGVGRFLDVNERLSRRWPTAETEVPLAVIMFLELMVEYKLTPDQVRALLGRHITR
jgi:hypothetical protein